MATRVRDGNKLINNLETQARQDNVESDTFYQVNSEWLMNDIGAYLTENQQKKEAEMAVKE